MRKTMILFFLAGTLAMIVVMGKTGEGLNKQPATPHGIINLELAYSNKCTAYAMNAWTASASQPVDYIQVAKTNTYWDFLFLVFYAPFLYLLAKQIAANFSGTKHKLGLKLASGAILAGMLDIGENAGMLITLNGTQSAAVALATAILSAIKWLLVIAAILYILIAGGIFIYRKLAGKALK